MKITITAQDVTEAIPRDPRRCPVALACRRAGIDVLAVDEMHLHTATEDVELPLEIGGFIRWYDGAPDAGILGLTLPYTFELEVGQS